MTVIVRYTSCTSRRRPATLGRLDGAIDGWATRVDGIQFVLSDGARGSLRATALSEAMANIETDATALAAATDVTAISVTSTRPRGE